MEDQKTFFIAPELCTGCNLCEIACSMAKEGQVQPSKSRVSVERHLIAGLYVPHVCRNCKNAPCVDVCKRGAIVKDAETGWVVINYERCSHCLLCIPVCPFGAIIMSPERKVLLCDVCGGIPKCVEVCATGAIKFISRREGMVSSETIAPFLKLPRFGVLRE
jgi:carbon-monoxide dehydrogenase iron sulfur subunit